MEIFLINKKLNLLLKLKMEKKLQHYLSHKAKPFVKRYKFIKGFNEGFLIFIQSRKRSDSLSQH